MLYLNVALLIDLKYVGVGKQRTVPDIYLLFMPKMQGTLSIKNIHLKRYLFHTLHYQINVDMGQKFQINKRGQ